MTPPPLTLWYVTDGQIHSTLQSLEQDAAREREQAQGELNHLRGQLASLGSSHVASDAVDAVRAQGAPCRVLVG